MSEAYKGWAVLELMGHRKRAGFVEEAESYGGKLLKIDIPVDESTTVTEFYGAAAIYAMRPCSEEIARKAASDKWNDPRPVRPVQFRDPEPKAAISHDEEDEGDEQLF